MKKNMYTNGSIFLMVVLLAGHLHALDTPVQAKKISHYVMPVAGSIKINNRTLTNFKILVYDTRGTTLTLRDYDKKTGTITRGIAHLPSNTPLKVLYPKETVLPLHVYVWDSERKHYGKNNCDWSDSIGSQERPLDQDQWDIVGSVTNGLRLDRTTAASRKAFKGKIGNPPSIALQ